MNDILTQGIPLKSTPIHPVRNDAPLLCSVHHAAQGSAGGLGLRIILAGLDAQLEFLTGFTLGDLA
jgi:hypothetical protein